MYFKKILLLVVITALLPNLYAQHNEDKQAKDSTSIAAILRGGKFEGHMRTYAMATTNKAKLSDYHALALGGGIHYESPIFFKHLSFEMGGMFIFNVKSSDLGVPDSTTQVKDRYEIALFDLENPQNKKDLDRMDEFNLRFHVNKKSKLTFGRQVINSPLINPQDGRMRPSMMSGAWFLVNEWQNTSLQGGWLWAAAPRSTVRWFSAAESIGVYNNGVNRDGSKSTYFMNLDSKGVFVLGLKSKISPNFNINAWNYTIENINNTAFLQTDFEHPLSKNDLKLKASAQIIRQDALHEGGNADPKKAYVVQGSHTWIYGARVGFSYKKSQVFANYTRITADGRFTFPREWGRDPLLTFMQRERNEGAGNVKAMNLTFTQNSLDNQMQTFVGLGYYKMPKVTDFKMNKYGLPSYIQLNLSLKYRFKGIFKNLESEFLMVHKWNKGDLYNNEKYRINKVDMTNWNWIMNYRF
ncbi:MAG: OprD family outer membrane porin [Saprospiraceae bacterium]|nr:OprD family outer membrane porin [Saprospiraceae bacterium]